MKNDKTKPTVTVSNPKWDHILLLPLPHPLSPGSLNLHKQWQNREVESQWASSEFYFRWNIYLEQPNGFFPKLHQSTRPMCQPHFIDQFLLSSNLFYPLWVSVTFFSHLHVMSFLYVVIFFFLFFWMATKTMRHNSSRLLCIQTTCK